MSKVVKGYDYSLLFEPTNAKVEFSALIKENLHLGDLKITIKETNEMTENKKGTFINNYFSTASY